MCWAGRDDSKNVPFLNLEREKGGCQFLKLGTGPKVIESCVRAFIGKSRPLPW